MAGDRKRRKVSQPSVYLAACQLTGPIQAAKGGQDLCVKMSWCMEDDPREPGAGGWRDLSVGENIDQH